MKVLFLTSNFLPNLGGIEIDTHNLLNYFIADNLDTRLLVPYNNKRFLLKSDYKKYLIPRNRLLNNYNWYRFSLSFIYSFWKFDIIFCTTCSSEAFYALKWREKKFKKNKRIKIIAKTSGSDLKVIEEVSYGQMLDEKMKTINLSVLKDVDIVIANSEMMKKEVEKLIDNSGKTIYTIPNGCNINKSLYLNLSKEKCKKELGIHTDETVITHITRDSKIKNTALFIDIAKEVIKNNIKAKFIIVGKICDYIQSLIDTSSISKAFIVKGEIDRYKFDKFNLFHNDEDYLKILKATDIGVFTSLFESFGNAAAEFGFLGIPIVINKNFGMSYLLANDAETIIVDETSVENYLVIIKKLIKKENNVKFGEIAKSNLKHLDFKYITSEYRRIFKIILGC